MSSGARTYQTQEVAPALLPDPFDVKLRVLAQDLRGPGGVVDLSDRERDFLYDLAREETRYPMPTVRKLCALSRRARNPLVREAFAELIREYSVPANADPSVTAAYDHETRSTGPADIAQRAFERDRNPITYARAKEALELQLAATQLALATTVRWGQKNGLEKPTDGRRTS